MPNTTVGIQFRAYDNTKTGIMGVRRSLRSIRSDVIAVAGTFGLYFGARGVARMLGSFKDAARDAAESENLFAVSMGDSADAARKWSKEYGNALGLNDYAVRRQVSTFNVMLDSMGLTEQAAYDMSRGMTTLANDMASFYNLRTEDAFTKIQSGISGEMEPLKRLGIILNETTIKEYALRQGWIKQGEQLSEVGKIYARYGSLMEQTSKAQGDMARTADQVANQERQIKAQFELVKIELGQGLLPTYRNAMQGISAYLIANKDDVVAWASGTVKVLGHVAKAYEATQEHFKRLTGELSASQLAQREAENRYLQEYPQDKAALTSVQDNRKVRAMGAWVPTLPTPKLTNPERLQELKDQLNREQKEITDLYAQQQKAIAEHARQTSSQYPVIDAIAKVEPPPGVVTKDSSTVVDLYKEQTAAAKQSSTDITAAMVRMYDQIDSTSVESFQARRDLLRSEYDEYDRYIKNKDMLNQWYRDRQRALEIEEGKNSGSFKKGLGAGLEELVRDKDTLGKLGYDYAYNLRDANRELFQALRTSGDLKAVWTSLLDRMASRAMDFGADQIFSLGAGVVKGALGFGGGASNGLSLGGYRSSGYGTFTANAKGNVYPGGISGLSNTVVTQPTVFGFANGGVVGEGGRAEAILPLTRIGGDLGVKYAVPNTNNQQRQQQPTSSERQMLAMLRRIAWAIEGQSNGGGTLQIDGMDSAIDRHLAHMKRTNQLWKMTGAQ